MTLLYNFEKKQVENVPESEVTNLISSGVYAPRAGVRVPVVAPDGEVGSVPSENAQTAFLQGFKFDTKEMAAQRTTAGIENAKREAFGQSTSTALAAGVARGATFGLSDVALRAAGGADVAEGLQLTRELQPVASTVGEVAGAVAGGFGATPVAGVTRLGEMAAAKAGVGVAQLAAKGTAGEIAAEILAKGAGSAVEGAFYGAGELLSEAALGDPNLTASNAAAVFGGNVLLGGAIGGLVPGAISTAKAAKNVPAMAMGAFGKLISFVKVSTPEQKKALQELAKATPEARAMRERVFDLVENPSKASDAAIEAVSKLRDIGKQEASILGDVRETVRDSLERVKSEAGDNLSEVSSVTSKLSSAIETASERSNRYVGGAAQDLTTVLDDLKKRAKAAENLADMHKAVHDSRMLLDGLFEAARKVESYEAKNTVNLIGQARRAMNDLLHSEKMFPGVGKRFQEADAAFSEYLTAAKEFRKGFEGKIAAPGGYDYEVKRGKAAQLVKSPASDLAQERQAVFDRMSNAVQKMNTAAGGAGAAGLAAISENLDKIKSARAAAILLDRLEAKTGRVMMASMLGYGLGEVGQATGVLGVPGAGAMGIATGALLANPKTVMTYLMRLERGNIAAANAIDAASKKYLGIKVPTEAAGATSKLWSGTRNMTINSLMRSLSSDDTHLPAASDDVSGFKQHLTPYSDIVHTEKTVRGMHPQLDELAPNTYAAVVNAHQNAIRFIQSKMPPDRDALFAGKVALAQSQKIALDRYTRAAFNPGELVHEMQEGTVRPETVEAVRAVHPDFYEQVIKQINTDLADPAVQKRIDRRRQLELSKVLGIPTSESLQNIDMLQQAWQMPEPVENERTPKALHGVASPTDAMASRMNAG